MSDAASRTAAGSVIRQVVLGIISVVVIVLLMLRLTGAFHEKVDSSNEAEKAEIRSSAGVKTISVSLVEIPRNESAVGTVEAVHQTAVASRLLSRVNKVNVQAGQLVKKGDILVELDQAELVARLKEAEAAVEVAEAKLDLARIEYESTMEAFRKNAAKKIEVDRAKAAKSEAEAAKIRAVQGKHQAEIVLGYATIRSQFDGKVVDKLVEAGDTVSPGQTLLTMYDPKRMQLVASVRESLAKRLVPGSEIDVVVPAIGYGCRGNISEIVPQAEAATRTFQVKVIGPCPEGVYAGMFGRLMIPLGIEKGLVIPYEAVRRIGQLDIVDVVEDGELHRRAVQLGRRLGENVEVLSGLAEGELVAVSSDEIDRED
ncbi:MAG TPA: efflux RND transporter periplasmic adaptor subunit [Phycisphaeraceae bacterium]|nr:efflux RND transporter periplasmic adaptor subunit [Phycisphaeraceae bacterium]